MNDNVDYKGNTCWFQYHIINKVFMKIRKENNKSIVCPLCSEEYSEKDELCMVMNNFKLFPNVFTHKSCVDELGFEETVRLLESNYLQAKHLKKLVDIWF